MLKLVEEDCARQIVPMLRPESEPAFRNARTVLAGSVLGTLIAVPALFAAIASAGAGHGDYVAARMLFPGPTLLTLLEGSIGIFATSAALLQFPLYGVLLGWSLPRKAYGIASLVGALHIAAAICCFTGVLKNFA